MVVKKRKTMAQGKAALIWRKETVRLLTEKAESDGYCLQAYCKTIHLPYHFLLKGPDVFKTTFATSLACLLGKEILAVPSEFSDPNTCSRCLTPLSKQKFRKLTRGTPAYVWRNRLEQGLAFKAKQAGLTVGNYCYRIGFWVSMNKSNQPLLQTRYAKALAQLLGESILAETQGTPKPVACSDCLAKGLVSFAVVPVKKQMPVAEVKPEIVVEIPAETLPVLTTPPVKQTPKVIKPVEASKVQAPDPFAAMTPFQRTVYQQKLQLEQQSAAIQQKRNAELVELAREADYEQDRRRNRARKALA